MINLYRVMMVCYIPMLMNPWSFTVPRVVNTSSDVILEKCLGSRRAVHTNLVPPVSASFWPSMPEV